MTRAIVVGNGNILVNFDERLDMRDFYYPMVGQLNHIGGYRNRLGVWVEDNFSWCNEDSWKRKLDYKPNTLVSEILAINHELDVKLEINDAVHFSDNIYLKKVRVNNLKNRPREIRLFFTQDFSICETDLGDTVLYDPELEALYHYKRNNYFLIKGSVEGKGFFEYSTGTKRFNHAEGTWRDAEDGKLSGNPIAQGSVDSTVSFRLNIGPNEEKTVYYWITVGKNFQEVKKLNYCVVRVHPKNILQRIENYWNVWLQKGLQNFGDLPQELVTLYKKSLLVAKSQIDNRGAILAGNDSDIIQFNRDHYSYMWPRDGALVAYALIEAGHPEMTREFFKFCEDALTQGGFLLHKYNPDGSVGSSWHPWVINTQYQLPIQEDETALVLYALWEYYEVEKDLEFVQRLYRTLIKPAANFLANYFHQDLHLPLESYDLWEERRGIYSFTCAAVYAGLLAAANFAGIFLDFETEDIYRLKAQQLKEAMEQHLYDQHSQRFVRGVYFKEGEMVKDYTLESSIYGLFAFGVFSAKDEKIRNTIKAIEEGLWVKTHVGGIARYYNDYYFQKCHDIKNIPGNPWIICTLWLAEWYIEVAEKPEDLIKAVELINWVHRNSLESGVLSEQLHPLTGEPLSVAPLTWSHATFVLIINKYLQKFSSFS